MIRSSFFVVLFFALLSAGVTGQYDSYSESYDGHFPVETCLTDGAQTWLVSDTTSATSLAEAVRCSGGSFNVTWRGSVLISRTLIIPDGTTLNITGEGFGAEVNGGGKERLFMAVGAHLHIEGLILSNGNSTYGGAIVAIRSGIFLNQTLFSGNIASTYGGAIYVGATSHLVWEGETSFRSNMAGSYGGAMSVDTNSSVSCYGETFFGNNSAGYGGALDVYLNSNVSWNGETSFVNNTANYYGGALYVSSDSVVSWDGETSFKSNRAGTDGGALSVNNSGVSYQGDTSFINNIAGDGGALKVYRNSTVSWNGKTSFVNNMANFYGGALYAETDSIVSWDGETTFANNTSDVGFGGALCARQDSVVWWSGVTSFVNNSAGDYGGALSVLYYSIVSWNGVTSFVNNTSSWSAGALYVIVGSSLSWDGATSFVNNIAGGSGGALYVYHTSSVSWTADTLFFNNTAGSRSGGAFRVYQNSNISWTGEALFIENNAYASGGALYLAINSNMTMGGDTYFLDNKAGMDGGAAYVYVGYDDELPSYIFVENNSTALFHDNTCGANGGAIAFIGEVVTSSPLNMTFWGNTAGVAGGAVYMSGVNIGMHFKGTRFIANSALIGGGLYSTGSGTAVTEDDGGSPVHNPTTFIGCTFIGNKAAKTGGAMDSGAGRDMIVNTSFEGNTASIGGALRLVGTTSLIGCEFIENLSGDDGGPGVSNDGIMSEISNCSFAHNVFSCQTSFFLDYNETGALFEIVCKGCDTRYSGCTFEGKEPVCLEELEYSRSVGGNTTMESLLIERRYWRATNTSSDILACYNAEACLGGLTGDQGYCREGYKGPYCSVCEEGYTASLGFACNKCSENAAGGVALAVVMFVAFFFASVAFVFYMLSGQNEATDKSIVARVSRFIPLHSVKIVVVVWQILTQFSTVANVVFPSVYQTFLDGVDILNFDLSWVLSAECVVDTDFHDQLFLVTLGPLVAMTILGGTYAAAMRRYRALEEARGIVHRKHVSMVLLLTFLVYSSVSSTLFKIFACDKLDDGKNYLRADYRIECDSFKHNAIEIYAGFMIILYVIGIPAFYGTLLYNNREVLMKNASYDSDESVKSITDLWKPYKPDRFYYEVIECVRRVLLTGALVFIYPNTAAQIATALMLATFFMIVSEALAPYASPWETWISRTGHAIVFVSMFLALLLKVDVSGERARSQNIFESVLIAAHSCLILVVLVEALSMVVGWREEVTEDTQPRIRPSPHVLSLGVNRVGTICIEDGALPSYEDVCRGDLVLEDDDGVPTPL